MQHWKTSTKLDQKNACVCASINYSFELLKFSLILKQSSAVINSYSIANTYFITSILCNHQIALVLSENLFIFIPWLMWIQKRKFNAAVRWREENNEIPNGINKSALFKLRCKRRTLLLSGFSHHSCYLVFFIGKI